ncbi:hypothetical protein HPB52_002819 [Rhipicephalus sanguineus]|uniref:Uncharacterized protein n=1 Tax=Rhipicephalus sanguineus TaxID=34632 RepID=A0A9D4T589_RHISA|nr:hypothetical protein HPB52_002819 [Rhipicephalus sanguineus]
MVAALTEQQDREDTMCPNKMQNILIISTQHQSNAAAYAKVLKIHTSTRAAYMAPPDKTNKGVIKNVDRSLDEATLHSRFSKPHYHRGKGNQEHQGGRDPL